ncbi:MAG: rod shape-determining protein MreC [bacterium]|nr:rod shape-determining protein MreC [bacterium]
MSFLLIRSVKRGGMWWKRALVLGVCVALLVLFQFFFPKLLRSGVHAGGGLFVGAWESLVRGVGQFAGVFRSKEALVRDAEKLREKVREQEVLFADYEALKTERDMLASLGGRGEEHQGIISGVLAVPPQTLYDTLLLDAGETAGVAEGDMVFNGSVLIGEIRRVLAHSSVVELFSAPGRETSVVIVHAGEPVRAIATGEGGGIFVAVLPKEVAVSVGDGVFLPGVPLSFFGEVSFVQEEPADAFKRVRWSLTVPLSRQLYVTIRPR